MLLVVDLQENGGDQWVEGCDVPKGARIAVIDPKGMQIAEDGTVTKGVHFMSPGDYFRVGRRSPVARQHFDMTDVRALSSGHLDIQVTKDGFVIARDNNSTNGTIASVGEYARSAVNEIGEHHKHHERFKVIIGKTAVEEGSVLAPPFLESKENNEHLVLNERLFIKDQSVEVNTALMAPDQFIKVDIGIGNVSLKLHVL